MGELSSAPNWKQKLQCTQEMENTDAFQAGLLGPSEHPYVCIHTRTHTHPHTHTPTHPHTHSCAHPRTPTRTPTRTHTHACTPTPTPMHAHTQCWHTHKIRSSHQCKNCFLNTFYLLGTVELGSCEQNRVFLSPMVLSLFF